MPQTVPHRPLCGLALLACVVGAIGYAHAASAETFSGPYVGTEVGYDAARNGPDGATYGGFAGWNFRLGRVIVGPEFRFGDSSASESGTVTRGTSRVDFESRSGRQIGISARAGYLVREDLLLFGRVGWENLKVTIDETRRPIPPATGPVVRERLSATDDSVTLGAGLEVALAPRWSLRGTWDWVEGSDRHLVKAGVAFHF